MHTNTSSLRDNLLTTTVASRNFQRQKLEAVKACRGSCNTCSFSTTVKYTLRCKLKGEKIVTAGNLCYFWEKRG